MIIDTTTTDRVDAPPGASRSVGHLDLLESHAIFVMREVAAEAERPVLLFSGGKDSAVLAHLAAKALRPGASRSRSCTWTPGTTSTRSSPSVSAASPSSASGSSWRTCRRRSSAAGSPIPGPAPAETACRPRPFDAIAEHGFDACFGGARRDDDKALLRFAAVGSLDDGKSMLIGRLHFDTRQPFDDQVAAVVAASARRDIGVAVLAVGSPLAVDPYRSDPVTGSFALVDEATNATVAAGMVDPPQLADPAAAPVGGA